MNTKVYPTLKSMSPQLLVTDLARSVLFYTEKLGFELSFRYEDFYCGIIKDGHSIHLKLVDAPAKKNSSPNSDNLDLLFALEEIEDLYEGLKADNVTITQPLRDMPYGREFYIADPDGHIIAFVKENNS